MDFLSREVSLFTQSVEKMEIVTQITGGSYNYRLLKKGDKYRHIKCQEQKIKALKQEVVIKNVSSSL